jgi:UDP-N-acetylglucosamine 2-epimerase (non-hydrolysing)/GDP/UDP-N,N'-diacetylbacillosamine 2-epimerase (hydrolysing)
VRKICVFTGTRAEYGLLYWVMKDINADPGLKLQLLVSGSHLAAEFGETWRQIEADGFMIDAKVDMQLGKDDPVSIAKSMGLCLAGCAEALERLQPDVFVLLGDRYEALAAAEAAMLLRIPIAHIHGGEASEGVIDDAIRHAITKMAHLHFPAADVYRERIIQLGEDPARVFAVGAPGLDHLVHTPLIDRAQLERELDLKFSKRTLLVTYHPVTLDRAGSAASVQRLLAALDRFPDATVVMTKANADIEGRVVNALVDEYAAARKGRVLAVTSLGQRRYLSTMAIADAVIGNSSSGIIEAPAMGKPTVNIGPRQDGRARAPSIIDCGDDTEAIASAIEQALSPSMQALGARKESPYKAGASKRIKHVLATARLQGLLNKSFHALH